MLAFICLSSETKVLGNIYFKKYLFVNVSNFIDVIYAIPTSTTSARFNEHVSAHTSVWSRCFEKNVLVSCIEPELSSCVSFKYETQNTVVILHTKAN